MFEYIVGFIGGVNIGIVVWSLAWGRSRQPMPVSKSTRCMSGRHRPGRRCSALDLGRLKF